MANLSGRNIGGFRLERELSKGAQGRVYEAVCEEGVFPTCPPGTKVVLKTMAANDESGDIYRRLSERTALLSELDHPNIVKYYGCFKVQEPFAELHVVVMEHLHGETLKARLAREKGGLDTDSAVRIAEGLILGLGAAATKGVCHRDVKPANVFLCRDGGVKVIDFEAAKIQSGSVSSSDRLAGSFDYMAPDFADPMFAGDERSDVFSAGVVIHEMLTGLLPYRKLTDVDTSKQADFAFLARWARNAEGRLVQHPIAISSRIRRLLAHTEQLFAGSLAVERKDRIRDFTMMHNALNEVRFRDFKADGRAYRILQLVGKGGFGEVFKARVRSTGGVVAIKHLLNLDYADRFYREAKIMSQLDDPCFVKFIDFMVVERAGNKDAFLVMDFLPGMPGNSLKDAIRSSKTGLPRNDVLAAFVRYAHGLSVLHSRGIFHRDIKPANLYYPEGRPNDSAIMDLGIARDVHGTVTTGIVPGTFDYMSPEVVIAGNRGESGMDIYALGLCLYEALTGKTAYPRLPRGYAAYAQFFRRAQSREKPVFDDPRVANDPALLSILVAMTEPDVSRRISDAAKVERYLMALANGTADASSLVDDSPWTNTVGDTVTVTAESPLISTAKALFGMSRDKPEVKPPERAPPARPKGSGSGVSVWTDRILHFALPTAIFAFIAAISYRYGPKVVESVADGVQWMGAKMQQRQGAREAEHAAKLIAERVNRASAAADILAGQYSTTATSMNEVDERVEEWSKNWKGIIPEDDYSRIATNIAAARESRLMRERKRASRDAADKAMRTDAGRVVKAYETGDLKKSDDLRAAWNEKWRKNLPLTEVLSQEEAFDQAREAALARIKLHEVIKAAAAAAAPVGKSYVEDGLVVADRMRELWVSDWKDRLPKDEFDKLSQKIDAIREKVREQARVTERRERREQLLVECRELCETREPVEYRSNRLFDAEHRVKNAYAAGVIDEQTSKELLDEIKRYRAMAVFRVVNKSDHEIAVGDVVVANGEQKVFSFTNGIPKGLAVVCRGFKPFPLDASVNGRTLKLTPNYLDLESVAVTVPNLGKDVICRIDNIPTRSGVAKVMPGLHECSYVRDGYETQVLPFLVELAKPIKLPPPGPWLRR